eukprot:gnl/TRDRNA2_/TRDRNA2_160270_c1_seq1.p1 gnl/TRDRNA2_/TRDRNA2_160270_c1~~gnl/TRDRNA2_/TRDRNA2_160270_c1_seq1.p1  ORF type:complete len:328 (-),score=65.01 gnl/TRDRNA2_/TRDRNA2_160270_c1_seq1:60-1013(-)
MVSELHRCGEREAGLFAAASDLATMLTVAAEAPDAKGEGAPPAKRLRREKEATPARLVNQRAPAPLIRRPIPEVKVLTLESFLLGQFNDHTPVLVRGACSSWPAVERWADADFWRDTSLGRRFVPVEMDYWFDEGYQMMTIRDFVEHCVTSESRLTPVPGLSGGGYLAQHTLLDQVPSLEADVLTPEIVCCGEAGQLLRQFFFGPKGTVTPVHFDPYENALCQVVGWKYIRLYAPSEANNLYARDSSDPLRNNSTIDPADILEGEAQGAYSNRFPLLVQAAFMEAVLEPGDLLYLPRGWWHFVKSLSTSISVAYHFN